MLHYLQCYYDNEYCYMYVTVHLTRK